MSRKGHRNKVRRQAKARAALLTGSPTMVLLNAHLGEAPIKVAVHPPVPAFVTNQVVTIDGKPLDTLNRTELRAACKANGIAYSQLRTPDMRAKLTEKLS